MHDSARAGVQDSAGNTTGYSLTPLTLARFLIGRREAILTIANSPWSIWIGAAFVFAAGLAREYDQEDLTRRPWVLLVPFAASMVITLLILLITRTYSGPNRQPFGREYRSLLGVVWMIAPMAMLYGIPYERFLSPADAMRANLWTLAVVSAWRVGLMIRIVSVLTGWSFLSSFFLVTCLADSLAVVALTVLPLPLPIIQIMGGLTLSEADQVLHDATGMATFWSVASLPVWALGALIVRVFVRPRQRPALVVGVSYNVSRSLIALACACLVIWLPALPETQSEQRLAERAAQLLQDNKIAEALTEMSSHQPEDYPPAWNPPPRLGRKEPEDPDYRLVVAELKRGTYAPWVRDLFAGKAPTLWEQLMR